MSSPTLKGIAINNQGTPFLTGVSVQNIGSVILTGISVEKEKIAILNGISVTAESLPVDKNKNNQLLHSLNQRLYFDAKGMVHHSISDNINIHLFDI